MTYRYSMTKKPMPAIPLIAAGSLCASYYIYKLTKKDWTQEGGETEEEEKTISFFQCDSNFKSDDKKSELEEKEETIFFFFWTQSFANFTDKVGCEHWATNTHVQCKYKIPINTKIKDCFVPPSNFMCSTEHSNFPANVTQSRRQNYSLSPWLFHDRSNDAISNQRNCKGLPVLDKKSCWFLLIFFWFSKLENLVSSCTWMPLLKAKIQFEKGVLGGKQRKIQTVLGPITTLKRVLHICEMWPHPSIDFFFCFFFWINHFPFMPILSLSSAERRNWTIWRGVGVQPRSCDVICTGGNEISSQSPRLVSHTLSSSLTPFFLFNNWFIVWFFGFFLKLPDRFNFAIFVSGFRYSGQNHHNLFANETPFRVPSLHVIGEADTVIKPSSSHKFGFLLLSTALFLLFLLLTSSFRWYSVFFC